MARGPRRDPIDAEDAPPALPHGNPGKGRPADIPFLVAEIATLTERVGNLIDRVADLKADGKETRDKLDLVRTDIATFKGAMRLAAGIYALCSAVFTALLIVFLTWLLRPATPPQAPPQPAAAAPSPAVPSGPKNEAAAATPRG